MLLTRHAEDQETHATLQRLLHDASNTAVPADTALALLRRGDEHGLRLYSLAFVSDASGAHDELVALLYNDEDCDWVSLRPVLENLTYTDDERVREAAHEVLDVLTGGGR